MMLKTLGSMMVIAVALAGLSCSSTGYNTQTGAAIGAVLGAIAGKAIGRNTARTLIGLAGGALVGAIVGNEKYKQWVLVLPRNDDNAFFVWSYTPPAAAYDEYLPVAKAMF